AHADSAKRITFREINVPGRIVLRPGRNFILLNHGGHTWQVTQLLRDHVWNIVMTAAGYETNFKFLKQNVQIGQRAGEKQHLVHQQRMQGPHTRFLRVVLRIDLDPVNSLTDGHDFWLASLLSFVYDRRFNQLRAACVFHTDGLRIPFAGKVHHGLGEFFWLESCPHKVNDEKLPFIVENSYRASGVVPRFFAAEGEIPSDYDRSIYWNIARWDRTFQEQCAVKYSGNQWPRVLVHLPFKCFGRTLKVFLFQTRERQILGEEKVNFFFGQFLKFLVLKTRLRNYRTANEDFEACVLVVYRFPAKVFFGLDAAANVLFQQVAIIVHLMVAGADNVQIAPQHEHFPVDGEILDEFYALFLVFRVAVAHHVVRFDYVKVKTRKGGRNGRGHDCGFGPFGNGAFRAAKLVGAHAAELFFRQAKLREKDIHKAGHVRPLYEVALEKVHEADRQAVRSGHNQNANIREIKNPLRCVHDVGHGFHGAARVKDHPPFAPTLFADFLAVVLLDEHVAEAAMHML